MKGAVCRGEGKCLSYQNAASPRTSKKLGKHFVIEATGRRCAVHRFAVGGPISGRTPNFSRPSTERDSGRLVECQLAISPREFMNDRMTNVVREPLLTLRTVRGPISINSSIIDRHHENLECAVGWGALRD